VIDVIENVISLCPVCHKKVHFAPNKERKKLLLDLHTKRKHHLENVGIKINSSELIELYG